MGQFLFICGPCNIFKSDKFAVFSATSGFRVDLLRKRGEPVREPEQGTPVPINPREEDPLDFLCLQGTGHFLPRAPEGSVDWIRADYTVEELLNLNSVSKRKSRKNAYFAFKSILTEYVRARNAGETTDRCIEYITQSDHGAVWGAMKRDRELVTDLQALFDAAPEALNW